MKPLSRNQQVRRLPGTPRMNGGDLVTITVTGDVAHPVAKSNPYRIGHDGVPRVLTGTGGIVLSHRVGDPCVGLAADHVEPGVSIKNDYDSGKEKDGANLALNTYSCVGNRARVITGPAKGKYGTVFGKHGGVNYVLVDFPDAVLRTLQNGDRMQIYARGLGLRFRDHPDVTVLNCDPQLIVRWGVRSRGQHVYVPVTHALPAELMGSGLGRNSAIRGDYDIQLIDRQVTRRYRLNTLRFGDFVAITDADSRFGRSHHRGFLTIGIIVHSDSTVSGHGPGVVSLLTGPANSIQPVMDAHANIANVLGLRRARRATAKKTLARKDRAATAQRVRANQPA